MLMRAAIAALALAACSIPDSHYRSVDGAPGSNGALNLYYVEGVGLDVDEGTSGSVRAYLSGDPPSHDITVNFTSDDPSRLQLVTPQLVFAAASYRQFQLVDYYAPEDADAVDNLVHLTGAGDDFTPGTLDVQIHDNDTMAIVPSTKTLTITEGSSMGFDVTLSAQPTVDVTVSLTSSPPDQVSPPSLVFHVGDYNVAQLVTVTSLHDTNTISEDETVSLSALGIPTAMVAIHNNDTGP